ncbi:MAG: hypothetical protein NTW87_00395 [Planctomycetota bacterium]|nr:hypothetical protein [Planctomycetota bacterium]
MRCPTQQINALQKRSTEVELAALATEAQLKASTLVPPFETLQVCWPRIHCWRQISLNNGAVSMDKKEDVVDHQSSPEAKVSLFRSLFRGRDDIYPRRFESRRTGKSGYQPACANEWSRGLCEKPTVKCSECRNRRFIPVTDETVRWHPSGRDGGGRDFVMGVYPMLLDETCFLFAADFDKAHWREDAGAFLETCRSMDVPAALERSRSGKRGTKGGMDRFASRRTQ